MQNTVEYQQAARQVERKIRFGFHLSIYLVVNAALILSHWFHQDAQLWSYGPTIGWGIAVLFHGLRVLTRAPHAQWKQRMIENELSKSK
jgi:hypothetical protein